MLDETMPYNSTRKLRLTPEAENLQENFVRPTIIIFADIYTHKSQN